MADQQSLLLLGDKTTTDLLKSMLDDLSTTPINNVGPGGICRLILARVSDKIGQFYDTFSLDHAKAFLSQASSDSLDLIGKLLNCTRYLNETDNDFKYRISVQSLSLEKANETSVRLAILSAPGVKDVVMKPFTHGTGSFSVYPVFDNAFEWSTAIEADFKTRLSQVVAYGIRAEVFQPRIAPVEIRARLLFDQRVVDLDKNLLRSQATQIVRSYVAVMKPGETLSPKDIKSQIMNISRDILNVEIYHFRIKDRAMILVEQQSAWNERFVESQNSNAILIS